MGLIGQKTAGLHPNPALRLLKMRPTARLQRLLRHPNVYEFEFESWELRVALGLQPVRDID
jgi:hypothetical protein